MCWSGAAASPGAPAGEAAGAAAESRGRLPSVSFPAVTTDMMSEFLTVVNTSTRFACLLVAWTGLSTVSRDEPIYRPILPSVIIRQLSRSSRFLDHVPVHGPRR